MCMGLFRASLVTYLGKNLPAVQETRVLSLGQEHPLEKGMAVHSSVLAWRIPVDGGAWRPTVHGITMSQTLLSDRHFLFFQACAWQFVGVQGREEKSGKGGILNGWGCVCLEVWLWGSSGNLQGCGNTAPPCSSRQDFMMASFLDTSQVCRDWSGTARPLCHLAANVFGAFAQPPGETELGHSWGRSLSAGLWGERKSFLRLGGTPASNNANITLV